MAAEGTEDHLAWEERQRTSAAIAAAVAALFTFVGTVWRGLTLSDLPRHGLLEALSRARAARSGRALESLRIDTFEYYSDQAAAVLPSSIVVAIGYVALGWALTYLAVATRARRPEMPKLILYLPLVAGGLQGDLDRPRGVRHEPRDQRLPRRRRAPSTPPTTSPRAALSLFAALLGLPGALGLALALVFVALNAMRVGLLTRFMGVLGIITGALQILPFGGPLPVVQCFWLIMLAAAVLRPLAGRLAAGLAHRRRGAVAELGGGPRAARPRGGRAPRRDLRRPEPEPEPVAAGAVAVGLRAQAQAQAALAAHRVGLLLLEPEPQPLRRVQREQLRVRRPPRVRSSSDTAAIVANASGTLSTAGWVSRASSVPLRRLDHRPAKIAAVAAVAPTTSPQAAPRAVSRSHQIPSSSSGQNVEAASANAQPTSTEMSSPRATSASSAGTTIAPSAAARKRRRRAAASRATLRPKSCVTVPASDTSSPDAVDMNAANAPAATSAPSSSPPSPGHAASGSRSTTVSVSAGQVELGHEHPAERAVDRRERVEQAEQPEHAHGRAARGRPVAVRVEADEDVRQPHRPQERRDQQRVDEQRRGVALVGDRRRPVLPRCASVPSATGTAMPPGRPTARRAGAPPRRRRPRSGRPSTRTVAASGNVAPTGSLERDDEAALRRLRVLVRRTSRRARAARRGGAAAGTRAARSRTS